MRAADGQSIGSYRVIEEIGRGASARVLRAQHNTRPDRVALKLALDELQSERLARELTTLERLRRADHPGLVRLHASGQTGGLRWLAFECLEPDGAARGQQPAAALPAQLCTAARLADALACAHGMGVVHTDVARGNIMFRGEQPVLIDWGAAHTCGRASQLRDLDHTGLGTPGFVAPERLRGEAFDSRADLYSLGCVLYELFTGRPPFVTDDLAALARCHLSAVPLPPSQLAPHLPRALDAILLGLLAKEPRTRTPYALQVARRFWHLLQIAPPSSRVLLPVFRPPIIEREAVLGAARERLGCTTQQLQLSLLCGLKGQGRSRVVEELEDMARERGWAVLRLEPSAADAEHPLACFTPLFERVCQALSAERALPEHVDALLPLTPYSPALREVLAELIPEPPAKPSSTQLQLGLWSCLQLAARGTLLCLLVDSFETVSEVAQRFCGALGAKLGADIACQVYIACDDDAELARDTTAARRFALPALSAQGTFEMLKELLASPLPVALVDLAQRATAGSPVRIVELAARLLSEGGLQLSDAAEGFTLEPLQCERIADEWERLPAWTTPQVGRIAGVAACCGMAFEQLLLDAVLRAFAPELAPAEVYLSELVATGVLFPHARGYRFVHASYWRACLQQLPAADGSHVQRALALARSRELYRERSYGEIGRHWAACGERERAVRCLSLGARRAEGAFADAEATACGHQALALLAPAPDSPLSLRGLRIGLRLLETLARTAQHDEVWRLGAQLLSTTYTDAPRALLERSRTAQLLTQSYRVVGDYTAARRALACAETLLPAAAPTLDRRLNRAWLETQLLGVFLGYSLRDLRAMRQRLTAMAGPVQRWGTAEQLATYKMWRANELILRRRYVYTPAAVQLERGALRILERLRARSREACMCQFDLAFMLLLGDPACWREASELLHDAEGRSRQLGDVVLSARIALYQAVALRRLRDVDGCERHAQQALAHASQGRLRGYMGAAHGCLAWVALKRDALRDARQHCEHAETQFAASGAEGSWDYPFQWLALLPRLAVAAAEEQLEQVRPTLHKLLSRDQAHLPPLQQALQELAEGWEGYGEVQIAQRVAGLVRNAVLAAYL